MSEPYIDGLIDHYETAADSNLESVEAGTMSAGRYVQWVMEKVNEEKDRAEQCFGSGKALAEEAVRLVRSLAGAKQQARFVRRCKSLWSFLDETDCAALDEAMVLADEVALADLYKLAVDCQIFTDFKNAFQAHIDVSSFFDSSGPADIQERLRKLISDPANDPQMIEGTLTLKRFADKAIKGLLAKEDVVMTEGDLDIPVQSLTIQKDRQIELEDAVRSGFKQGLGSRQNAPAEWIGESL